MRNKKQWLVIKGVLILILVLVIVGYPTQDSFRKWFRFLMLIVFVISFVNDVNRFRKNND